MIDFLASAHAIDLVLALIAVEAVVLYRLARTGRCPLRPRETLLILAPGAFLLLAARAVIAGLPGLLVPALFLAALIAHLTDLRRQWTNRQRVAASGDHAETGLPALSPRLLYRLASTHSFSERGMYLNLGYWAEARTIDEACEAMVELVGKTAGIGSADDVVDVGFGFGEQDIYWTRRFAPRGIVGVNITPEQVQAARERVRAEGLEDRIDLREGSATATGLPDACCDVVTAVECAFHFDTREQFFAEAARVLRPGGRIVLADSIPMRAEPDPWRNPLRAALFSIARAALAVPRANVYPRDVYAAKLAAAGFEDVRVESIRDHVFPGWSRALAEDAGLRRRLGPAGWLLRNFPDAGMKDEFDYVLAFARRRTT
ncbi:Ubiquinone/menaquinone biosynthesis C-methylase UbiE [Rhodoblastus acidophilus]|uniref:Ubiquinone/menaquinone biosynthesis C-methylase UbiE n=1 Tax=Rhodoblastus acidophilus TaxID=1074 RepID=A0A212QMX4_RHOAC|nr:class I SAM-dependent methyltransferase [Rhodoblastus acidophilus]SNB60719.1 Ubiquinone/menaquinone biosynthesis C-methylase UbiE [Rhodoblastus acidophilus]